VRRLLDLLGAWWCEDAAAQPWWFRALMALVVLAFALLALNAFLWLVWPMACGIDGGRC
jgi:hypothetical protein